MIVIGPGRARGVGRLSTLLLGVTPLATIVGGLTASFLRRRIAGVRASR